MALSIPPESDLLRSVGTQNHDSASIQASTQVVEQPCRSAVRPLQVVQQDQYGVIL